VLLCYKHIIFCYFCDSSVGVNKDIMLNSLHPSQEEDFFSVYYPSTYFLWKLEKRMLIFMCPDHVFQLGVYCCVKVNYFIAAFWISPKIVITHSQW